MFASDWLNLWTSDLWLAEGVAVVKTRQGQPPRLWPTDTWSVATFQCQRNIVMRGPHKCQIYWCQGRGGSVICWTQEASFSFKMTQDTKELSEMEGGMVALMVMVVILLFLLIFFCFMPYIREQLRYFVCKKISKTLYSIITSDFPTQKIIWFHFLILAKIWLRCFRRAKYWEDPANDPRWNKDNFQFSPKLARGSDQKTISLHSESLQVPSQIYQTPLDHCQFRQCNVRRSPGRQLREAEQRGRLQCAGQPRGQPGDQPGRQLQERVGAAQGRGPGHHRDPVQVCQQQQPQCADMKTNKLKRLWCENVCPISCKSSCKNILI